MAMELDYDRSLYGVEHQAGPFEITDEIIDRANSSTGETGAAFRSDEGAKEAGYRGRIAPPASASGQRTVPRSTGADCCRAGRRPRPGLRTHRSRRS